MVDADGAAAAGGFGSGDFETTEKGVLRWLLRRAEVSQAVDLALAGGGGGEAEEAATLLLRSVKDLLGQAPPPTAGAEAAAAAAEANGTAGEEGDEAEEEEDLADEEEAPPPAGGATASGQRRRRPLDEEAAEAPPAQRARHGLEWMGQCQEALQVERDVEASRVACEQGGKEQWAFGPVPVYWKIDLPEVKQVLGKRNILPEHFSVTEHPHVTLLYLGGLGDEAAAKRNEMPLEQLQGMREALEALNGEEFEVRMTKIVIEERVACAVVSLPPILPCSSSVPHVTLGTKVGVPPRFANELLEEVQAGRTDGLTVIELPAPRPLKGTISLHYSAPGDD